jgi:hypothetical protein
VAEESASEDGGDAGDAASSNTTFFIELFSPSLIIFADLIPNEACIDCWGLIVLRIMHVVLAQALHAWSLGLLHHV